MDEEIKKQMSSTNKKQKIFNVRKLQFKQNEGQDKYIKPQFSPFQVKDNIYEPVTRTHLGYLEKITRKTVEYNSHIAILSSAPYKELNKKYNSLKEDLAKEKQRRLEVKNTNMQELKQKQDQLTKFQVERQRLVAQREKLSKRRDELKSRIYQIQNRNQQLRSQQIRRNQQYRILNMEYLRNMLMSMRYQNGIDIDIDNMSYEELLQLEEKMGSVSKGLTQEQFQKLVKKWKKKVEKKQGQEQSCTICCEEVNIGEEIISLLCHHSFHQPCIKQWLNKEKVCPLCKQEILIQ